MNTVSGDTFQFLKSNAESKLGMLNIVEGSDRPLKAYATAQEIEVMATFIAELFISDDRPRTMEKFYVVNNARALLGRNTAIRYSVLQCVCKLDSMFQYKLYQVSISQVKF